METLEEDKETCENELILLKSPLCYPRNQMITSASKL